MWVGGGGGGGEGGESMPNKDIAGYLEKTEC